MDKTSRTQADAQVGGLSNQHVSIIPTVYERANRRSRDRSHVPNLMVHRAPEGPAA